MEKLAQVSTQPNLNQEFEGNALLTRWGCYQKVHLANGATIHLSHFPDTKYQELRINVGSGTAMERPDQRGFAHFLEHVVLDFDRFDKQIRSYSRDPSTIDKHERGGSTRHRQTLFDAYYPKAMAPLLIPTMVDRLINPVFSGKELEREKNVVLAEMARASVKERADPSIEIIDSIAPEYGAQNHILGTQQSIRGLSIEPLMEFHRSHYGASNMNIFYSGDLSGDSINFLKHQIGRLPEGESIPRLLPPKTIWENDDAVKVLIEPSLRKEVEVVVAIPFPCSGDPDYPAARIIFEALNDPTLRLLFNEMRMNSGLVYGATVEKKNYDDITPVFISFTLENVDKIKPALMSLSRTLKQLRESVIEQPGYASRLISVATAQVSTNFYDYGRRLALEYALSGKIVLPEHKIAAIESQKAADIERVAEKMFRDPFIYLGGRVSKFGDYSFE